MANSFAYNTITHDGAALIAQATAANPIVIVGAKSCTLAAQDNADLADKPLSWYDGKSGSIAAVSATDAVARIVAKYTNSGTAQIAKSFCITARLASQTDASAVVLTAKSDPDAAVFLPGADDVSMIVNIPHSISIDTSGIVEVTPGASASVADLERFVSLSKAGQPSVGEVQTVLGLKTLSDGIAIPSTGSCSIACTASFASISTTGDTSVGGDFSASGTGRISGRLDAVQGLYSYSWVIARESGSQFESGISITQKISNSYVVRATLSADTDLPSGVTTGLLLSAHHLRPATNEGGSLGTSTCRWDYVLSRIVTADRLHGLGEVPGKDQVVSSPLFLPIGAPVLAFIRTNASVDYLAGDIIAPAAAGQSVTNLAVASFANGSGWSAGQEIMTSSGSSVYKFKLLSQVSASSSGVVAMIVRVPSDFNE